jgi:hypothetical protein
MEPYQIKVLELLRLHKAVLLRKRKHSVYRLSSGKKWVTPNTASDTAAWQNNYTDLRKALGYKTEVKTQTDFEHQKKEPYVKAHVATSDFLADLPDREVLPAPPPGPMKAERAILEKARQKLAEQASEHVEREIFDIGGRFPDVIKKGPHKKPGGRTSKPYTFSAEVLARANSLLILHGEVACKKYLDEVKSGHVTEPQKIEKKEETQMTLTDPGPMLRVTENGSYSSMLDRARQDLRVAQQRVNQYQLEVIRAQETIKLLEQVNAVQTASADTLKGLNPSVNISSNGHSSNGHGTRGRRGRLTEAIKEIIATSPGPMNKVALVKELQKFKGDQDNRSAYQTVWAAMKAGWLQEQDGVVKVVE